MTEQEPTLISIPVEWHVPEDVVSGYATNILVQHTEHEFIISFYEAQPPILFGDKPDEVRAQLKQIRAVRANCVARVVVAAGRMPEFVKALQGNLDDYLAKKTLVADYPPEEDAE